MTIVQDVLEYRTRDTVALQTATGAVTYRELLDRTARYVGGFEKAGVEPGSGILVASTSLVDVAAATFAGWWHGLRVAVIRGDASVEAKRAAADIASVALQLWDDLPPTAPTGPHPPVSRLTDLLGPPSHRAPVCGPSDVLHETFTSGTTGTPKCVSRSMGALSADVGALNDILALGSDDCVTATIPALSSISVLPALRAGATIAMLPISTPRALRRTLSELPVTAFVATPYLFELLTRHGQPLPLPETRLVITTSAHLRASTAQAFTDLTGLPPRNVLCTSEAGHVTFNDADDPEVILHSVGRVMDGVTVEIAGVEPGDPPPPPGQPGRIVVRSPHVATGYRGRDQDGVFVDGAVRTSDLGYFDADGFLYLTGRCDDRIHVGELIVHPWAIEERLLQHPAVSDAVVVPVEHDRLGQVAHARVVCTDVSDEELAAHCQATLDRDAVPRRFVRVPEVPRDNKGQVIRSSG
jgi:acyl-coenzyme A synthetase/AMP-(fatty) acid ligase